MGRKKHKHEEHVNLERWLVSYADFITLLFATFVILYALSQLDLAKFKDLKISMREAFAIKSSSILKGNDSVMDNKGSTLLDSAGLEKTDSFITPILAAIEAKEEKKQYLLLQEDVNLKELNKIEGVKTEVTERGFVINMMGNVFFDSATSSIRPESLVILDKIGKLLKVYFPYNIIRVEGHTDNEPMKSKMFPSNWELSAYRAASVVRYLSKEHNINDDQFVTVGYADSRPIASNETLEGKKANRRVEIVVLKSKFLKAENKAKEFQRRRKERLEEIARLRKEREEKAAKNDGISEAAKKLMGESKDSKKDSDHLILRNKDKYEIENEKILKKLENMENKIDQAEKKELFFKGVQEQFKH